MNLVTILIPFLIMAQFIQLAVIDQCFPLSVPHKRRMRSPTSPH